MKLGWLPFKMSRIVVHALTFFPIPDHVLEVEWEMLLLMTNFL